MRRHILLSFIVMCALILNIGAYGALEKKRSRDAQAASFFSAALREARIQSAISWRGTRYIIADGVVYKDEAVVPETSALPVLELAYEQALARRSPIFGLAGTDPSALKDAVQALSHATQEVASAATSSADSFLIRTSLYPLSFLNALADLEDARERFITSGTQTNALLYRAALHRAAWAGQTDSKRFQKAMWRLFNGKRFIMHGIGGPISSEDLTRTAWNITLAMDMVSEHIQKRERCIGGDISACDVRDISFALPAVSVPSWQKSSTLPAQAEKNRRLMIRASDNTKDMERPIIALQTSKCLGSLEVPYYVTPRNRIGTDDSFFFLGELFFAKTDGSTNTLHRYLGETEGISYMPVNQLTFYMCPDTQDDSGRARAILAAASYAHSHPSYLPGRTALLTTSDVITEEAAVRYIHSLVDDALSRSGVMTEESTQEVEELALMFRHKNAGLNVLIDEMAHTNGTHARYAQSGVPFDESARVMFMTHSGFLSLFLAHNILESYTYDAFRSTNKNDTATLYRAITPYSSLARCVNEERIVQDIRSFILFERIGPQIANASPKLSYESPERITDEPTESIFGILGRIPLGEQIFSLVHDFVWSFLHFGNNRIR